MPFPFVVRENHFQLGGYSPVRGDAKASQKVVKSNDVQSKASATAVVLGRVSILGRTLVGSAGVAAAVVVGDGGGRTYSRSSVVSGTACVASEVAGFWSVGAAWRFSDSGSESET